MTSGPPAWLDHVAYALAKHVRDAKRDGITLPPGYGEFLGWLAQAGADWRDSTPWNAPCNRPHMDDDRALTVSKGEAAALLGCSPRTVGKMLKDGTLHRVDLGTTRSCRIAKSEILALVAGVGTFRAQIVVKTDPGPQDSGLPDPARPLPPRVGDPEPHGARVGRPRRTESRT